MGGAYAHGECIAEIGLTKKRKYLLWLLPLLTKNTWPREFWRTRTPLSLPLALSSRGSHVTRVNPPMGHGHSLLLSLSLCEILLFFMWGTLSTWNCGTFLGWITTLCPSYVCFCMGYLYMLVLLFLYGVLVHVCPFVHFPLPHSNLTMTSTNPVACFCRCGAQWTLPWIDNYQVSWV